MKSDIGLIGLGVMGQNLVLNMANHGYSVSVFNRTLRVVDEFIAGKAEGYETIRGTHSISELVESLAKPRRIMLMVKAGRAVDAVIEDVYKRQGWRIRNRRFLISRLHGVTISLAARG